MLRLRQLKNKLLIIFLFSLVLIFQSFNFALATECPQKRKTVTAPKVYLDKVNPLRNEPRFVKKGKVLSHIKAKPIACKQCHGMSGMGDGSMSPNLNPKPRNFTCKPTMEQISDGQLFWIIKNGSKGTAMPAYSRLSDQKIWQLIHYIRSLSKEVS
jgi:cytochrome c553|tara:strand:- start:797 stop:1264 length:468 start_codon:yes stop_codon:yes gene_type:complete